MPSSVPRIDSSDAEAPSGSADGADEKLLQSDASPSADASSTTSKCMRAARAAAACTLYLLVGPALILVNKQILSGLNFAYPMALSGLGLLFSSTTCTLLVHACGAVKLQQREVVTGSFYLWNLVPVGACMASTLAFGNAVYLYLPVGFIQMLKAFTPTVTLLFLWLSSIETPSAAVVGCVTAICAGTITASVGAVDAGAFSLVGVVVMFLAEATEALKLVLQQKLLQNLKFGVRNSRARTPRAPPARPPARTPDRGDVSGGAEASAQRETRVATLARSLRGEPHRMLAYRSFHEPRATRSARGTDTGPTSPHRTRLTRARGAQVIEGQYWMAPISALWLFGAAAILELPRMLRKGALEVPAAHPLLFCAAASLGFLVNISSFLVIKEVGSVALKVLGTARNAGLVLFSALVMGEATTPLEIGGYAIALLGFAAFNYAKIAGL